jgi:anti-sigma factor ChrR (cupin superfamily)
LSPTADFAPTPDPLPNTPSAITVPPPELPEIEAVATGAFEKAEQPQDGADVEELERLQGRYVQQINARLGRVLRDYWPDRPELSQCTARVIQDEFGRVLDVDLHDCAADDAAHAMLTRVIRAAGPLPRPPEGLAMASYLTLDLSSF